MEKYLLYKKLLSDGLRKKANIIANELVLYWKETNDNNLLNKILNDSESKNINHILFKGIVFPHLLSGYHEGKLHETKLLIKHIQHFYSDQELWKKIEYKSEIQLLIELLKSFPDDEWVKTTYIRKFIDWLQFCGHEYPAGILYGMNGATAEECDDILLTIDNIHKIDEENIYFEFLEDLKDKKIEYKSRLTSRST